MSLAGASTDGGAFALFVARGDCCRGLIFKSGGDAGEVVYWIRPLSGIEGVNVCQRYFERHWVILRVPAKEKGAGGFSTFFFGGFYRRSIHSPVANCIRNITATFSFKGVMAFTSNQVKLMNGGSWVAGNAYRTI